MRPIYRSSTRDELYHHGIKGMKWGVRRYQYSDGSLTPAGKKRVTKDSDMLFYDYRRKERKLKDPITNRKNVRNDERLRQAAEEYKKLAIQENDKLLKEKTDLRKAGYKFVKNPDSNIMEHNADVLSYVMSRLPTMKAAQKRYTELEVDVFADALLADMRLKNTEQAKTFVKKSLIENNAIVRSYINSA